jgi:hypothetical protein
MRTRQALPVNFQDFSCLLYNPKVNEHAHKSPPLVPVLSQMDLIHSVTRACPDVSSAILSSVFLAIFLYELLIFFMRATYPAHPIVINY